MKPALETETAVQEGDVEETVSRGAVWRRVDFHLHSPGVHTFKCPAGADLQSTEGRSEIVERYVDQLEQQNIEICAITDYNGVRIEWFEWIRQKAAERDILVLPGAEVSLNAGKHGLHVLAIFSASADLESINRTLHSLDRNPAEPLFAPGQAHRDIYPVHNAATSLNGLREQFECLLIPAHPNDDNGFCKTFRTQDAARFLADLKPDAIEYCAENVVQRLRSSDVLAARFFDNIAWVDFSDPKAIDEIGTKTRNDGRARATYLKLSATGIDALRLALHDPTTRLSLGTAPESEHSRILSMAVEGSGYLGNLDVAFNDDLNVIIGGRGAGKSAILETLRYALTAPVYSEHEARTGLVRHALASGGKVTLTIERPLGNGACRTYKVERILGEDPRVTELETNRTVEVLPLDLFGSSGAPTVFGQREIYSVSGSEEYRLQLLDDLIGDESRQRAREVRDALEKLKQNARTIQDREKRLLKRDEYVQRLKTVEHEIAVYEKHGAAEKLTQFTSLRSDGRHLLGSRELVEESEAAWHRIEQEVIPPLAAARSTLGRGKSGHKEILTEASEIIATLESRIRKLLQEGREHFKDSVSALKAQEKRWQQAVRPLEDELNRIKREARTEALDPDRLLQLSEEKAGLAPLIEQFERVEQELNELRNRRIHLLQAVRKHRHDEHRLRRERANAIEELLEGRLKLEVVFKGQKAEYGNQLKALLKGSKVSTDAIENLITPEATDGIALAEAISKGSEEIQQRFGLTAAMAERLITWFSEDEARLFQLQTIIPGDDLRVSLVLDGNPRPLARLSPGQRATAILLLLFAFQERILILDQPEDDLDNRFVYEDVVQILREQKGLRGAGRRRQVITATHNPNIPVLGDAELVLPLDPAGNRTAILHRGSIDDSKITTAIKDIMEGGEDAFRLRAEKYGAFPE